MTRAKTMIPIPPSHCVNPRQKWILYGTMSKFGNIENPVVVKPDMASKYASK
ncbi:conserved hypothetical protein [Methanothermobacter sp. MT-2]|nr:conserved hypothetical protein [Methanothermobacter sp. MT-2]